MAARSHALGVCDPPGFRTLKRGESGARKKSAFTSLGSTHPRRDSPMHIRCKLHPQSCPYYHNIAIELETPRKQTWPPRKAKFFKQTDTMAIFNPYSHKEEQQRSNAETPCKDSGVATKKIY